MLKDKNSGQPSLNDLLADIHELIPDQKRVWQATPQSSCPFASSKQIFVAICPDSPVSWKWFLTGSMRICGQARVCWICTSTNNSRLYWPSRRMIRTAVIITLSGLGNGKYIAAQSSIFTFPYCIHFPLYLSILLLLITRLMFAAIYCQIAL